MGERVTRAEAMVLLGHGPHNRASISQYIRKGVLTVYYGEKQDPSQRGRRRVQYFDVDEIDAILKRQAEIRQEGAARVTPGGSILGPGRRGWAGRLPDEKQQAETKLAREEFDRETVTDAQARALLGVSAWELMQLVMNKQVRTRRMMGEERYERADVMVEQARRDAAKKR